MEPRISLITLGVADVARARAFYRRLGFVESSVGGDEVAFFQCGPMALGLYGHEDLAADAGVPYSAETFTGFALAENVRTKGEVDAVLAEAKRAGGVITKAAEAKSWGGYSGYFIDPDGHLWEIAYNPGFELGADAHCGCRNEGARNFMLKIDLSGRICVVTGGAGQLGRAMVRTLADCGAAVAINYLTNREGAEGLVAELKGTAGRRSPCRRM